MLRSDGLLCDKTDVKSATFARNPDAIQRAKSNFPARFECGRLDIAGKFDGFKMFRFRFAIIDDGRSALRTELRPAALIFSSNARGVP